MKINAKGLINKMTTKPKTIFQLVASAILFAAATYFILFNREFIDRLNRWWFFPIWLIFFIDTIKVIFPQFKPCIAAGKHFLQNFKPSNYFKLNKIKGLIVDNVHPIIFAILWLLMLGIIAILYFNHIIDDYWIYYIVLFFNLSDYICINIWCPFRAIMKNRCCVTCRIYNWDHFMKYSPLIFIVNPFGYTLVAIGLVAGIQWEIMHRTHPERFYQLTNENLTCGNCARNCIRQDWIKDYKKSEKKS